MTRPFRLEEDERRYFALRSELYIRLARSGVHAQTVHDILRNFGKLEDMMFFEGVRQGMAAACLASPEQTGQEALAVHLALYGNASTPLARVENSMAVCEPHAWLSHEPLKFAPLTIAEAIEQYGDDLAVAAPAAQRQVAPAAAKDDFDPMAALEALANGASPLDILGIDEPLSLDAQHEEPIEQPALLDRARDALMGMSPQPRTWADLVLGLMRELRMDAAVIDDLMSGPMGMTVISQAGLLHLHPGEMPEMAPVERPESER